MEKFIKVMSLEEALKINGETVEQFNWRTERDSDGERAGKELDAIAKGMNNGKHLDYKDTSVWKCFPVFRAVGSGSGFVFNDFAHARSFSYVGARHLVINGDAAEFFGTQHRETWNRYINGQ